jgi:uncharacterized repeat protein (TIGR03803 family)
VSTSGGEHVLHSFGTGADGIHPEAPLVFYSGALYGTTYDGGSLSGTPGTVFAVSQGQERVLHTFGSGTDGYAPQAGLVVYNGVLYGTTYYGGSNGAGTVFAISPSGKERVVYNFKPAPDGELPAAGLAVYKGVLYGTTSIGGAGICSSGCGTVFAVTPSGKERVLYRFGGGSDGGNPRAGLVVYHGALYGTTMAGGGSGSRCGYGCGTVFTVSLAGKERVLHRFGSGTDGAGPQAGLIVYNATLYGTTVYGGACNNGSTNGCGTVFAISPLGKERILHTFGTSYDGQNPFAGLVVQNGTLYGTTDGGGTHGYGTVFALP